MGSQVMITRLTAATGDRLDAQVPLDAPAYLDPVHFPLLFDAEEEEAQSSDATDGPRKGAAAPERQAASSPTQPALYREPRGSRGMGVVGNSCFDHVLLSITNIFAASCSPMLKPPSLGPPLVPLVSKAPKGNGIGATGSKNWVWF